LKQLADASAAQLKQLIVRWRWTPVGGGFLLADGCRGGGRHTAATFSEQIETVE
jgi:hypothetical protein